ncbi:hypothetical protein AOQ84DRAFT_385576 [Glonium stellatum]|uniref:Uncharacterized protein n=1 Tax=Glonium stellatum TaxID=574774 RepID=A0A8E2FA74_9PEZI|nr:hypothetical protein AOQ84DRAFT_385576 [Glonium stellatum]
MLLRFSLLFMPALVISSVHRARQYNSERRQDLTTVCGLNPVDCGNGWCCFEGQNCMKSSTADTLCVDIILTDVGGGPMTFYAVPFSSFLSDMSSIDSALTSLGITASTFPTTLTGTITALPTYSDTDTSVIIPTWTGWPATTSIVSSTPRGPAATVMPANTAIMLVPAVAAVAFGVAVA